MKVKFQKQIIIDYINASYCFGDLEAELGKTPAEICDFWKEGEVWHIDDHQLAGIELVKVIDGKVVQLEET